MLPIVGFQGTSLIDFPGKISSIVFLGGCNLRCPYCHNGVLFNFNKDEIMPLEILFSTLEKRKKFIDGVVFTGGEPTLYRELIPVVKEIKKRFNLEIKFDSNGLNPDFLAEISDSVDYFSIDIKGTPLSYSSILGSALDTEEIEKRLLRTKEILETSGKKVEYRTTMYPKVVDSPLTLNKMLKFIPKNADYYLQRFMPETAWAEEAQISNSYSPADLEKMINTLRDDVKSENIFLRTYS